MKDETVTALHQHMSKEICLFFFQKDKIPTSLRASFSDLRLMLSSRNLLYPGRGANNFFPASPTLEKQQHKIFMRPRFVLSVAFMAAQLFAECAFPPTTQLRSFFYVAARQKTK